MAEVFLSYSSQDRQAAQRVEQALSAQGIEVFWDQETPPGVDWDTWIRGKLANAKAAVVLWSQNSIASPNVRHEAMVARDAGKLVPAMIETLSPSDFPMGLYLVQGVQLQDWRDANSAGMVRLVAEVQARVTRDAGGAPVLNVRGDTTDLFALTAPRPADAQRRPLPPKSGPGAGRVGWPGRRKAWASVLAVATTAVVIGVTAVGVHLVRGDAAGPSDVAGPPGEPVTVNDVHTYWSAQGGLTVVMPEGIFADSQLAELNSIDSPYEQVDWLVEHGAAPIDTVYVSIAVSGNRPDGVRIVDVKPIRECSTPYAGAIFLAPPQGADNSIILKFNLDQVDPQPRYTNQSDEAAPFFPNNTISLKKGEEQVLLVAATTKRQACSFRLELTVLDGNKRVKQQVSGNNGKPFKVSALTDSSNSENVYYNTAICPSPDVGYVRIPALDSGCPQSR